METGGSKNGAWARVSCIGHLTRRFGSVRPHGRVKGRESRSMAVAVIWGSFSSVMIPNWPRDEVRSGSAVSVDAQRVGGEVHF